MSESNGMHSIERKSPAGPGPTGRGSKQGRSQASRISNDITWHQQKHEPRSRQGPLSFRAGRADKLRIDYVAINTAALPHLPSLLARWLPRGRRQGFEYLALNPTRADRSRGSFKVNLRTGRWADFATGDRGGDVISLAAYLFRLSQAEAARNIASMLCLPESGR